MADQQRDNPRERNADETSTRQSQSGEQDNGVISRRVVDNQVWETDAGREDLGLGERIADGEVAPPERESVLQAYPAHAPERSAAGAGNAAGEAKDAAGQPREPASDDTDASQATQRLGDPGTTGNELDAIGGQPY
ncbi:MAG: hypothetical protein ACHQ4H_08080 [Ktedonobacterales bacterium]